MKRLLALDENVIQFCRFLREKSFTIGPSEAQLALESLYYIDWNSPLEFKQALKSSLSKNAWQYHKFDELYKQYWSEIKRAQDSKLKDSQQPDRPSRNQLPSIEVIKDWLYGQKNEETREIAKYSAGRVKQDTDLSRFENTEFKEWYQILQRLKKKMLQTPNRRVTTSNKKGPIFLRQMIRKALREGGEYTDLVFQAPKKQKVKVLLLCDVSKSMEMYSEFIIQMLYSFQNSGLSIETFVFSTSLYRISQKLKNKSFKESLIELSSYVDEWSSGTRIGDCFHALTDRYGKLLTSKTYVFVMSDGWDSGDANELSQAIRKIKKSVKSVVWLNPLAFDGFKPEVQGLKAALPYVDAMVPATKVSDLKQLL